VPSWKDSLHCWHARDPHDRFDSTCGLGPWTECEVAVVVGLTLKPWKKKTFQRRADIASSRRLEFSAEDVK
jgi:hypothetical protein